MTDPLFASERYDGSDSLMDRIDPLVCKTGRRAACTDPDLTTSHAPHRQPLRFPNPLSLSLDCCGGHGPLP